MSWLIALAVLVLLAILPLGVRLRYNADGFFLALRVGVVSIPLCPRRKGKKPAKKEKPPAKKNPSPQSGKAEPSPPKEKGGPLTDFLPLVKLALDFLQRFLRKIRIDHLELKLILAGDDPCDLAVNYGRGWEAVANLLPRLERVFTIRRRNVEVECDFMGDTTRVIAGADITITLGRLLALALTLAFRGLREYRKIKGKRGKAC